MARRRNTVQPIALLLGTAAYFYGTINNLVDIPGSSVIVDTNYGQLRGMKGTARNGRMFFEFLGIPYAQAPVGDLRFEVRMDAENLFWPGVYNTCNWNLKFSYVHSRRFDRRVGLGYETPCVMDLGAGSLSASREPSRETRTVSFSTYLRTR
jgi:hypothetical protein